MNDDICFVILNYNLVYETINCINSIKKNIDTMRYHIIVVDNGSTNRAGEKIKKQKIERVDVLIGENIGFAKGNNIGINYARKLYHPMYICCMNNDTLLEQKNFYTTLNTESLQSNVAVIGPKIRREDSSIQALRGLLYPIGYYENLIEIYKNGNVLAQKKNQEMLEFYTRKEVYDVNTEYENIFLSGCCIIFTPIFFLHLKGFNPNTFMYGEEQLLLISLIKEKLIGKYFPKLEIRHLEMKSTKIKFKSDSEIRDNYRRNKVNACKILIQEMKTLSLTIVLLGILHNCENIKLSPEIDKIVAVADFNPKYINKNISIDIDSINIFGGRVMHVEQLKNVTFDYVVLCDDTSYPVDCFYLKKLGISPNKMISYSRYMNVCRGIKW